MDDLIDIGNKSQTVIKFDNMDIIEKDQSELANKNGLKKKKMSTAQLSKPIQHRNKMNYNRSQHLSNPSTIQQSKVITNMNVDKRKYLSKYIEQTDTKNFKKSITPESCFEFAKKTNNKLLGGHKSATNKYEVGKSKRTESVYIPHHTK